MVHEVLVELINHLADSPADAPPTPTGDHAIVLALIYVVGGGLITILGSVIALRVGRRVPVDPPANVAGPDDEFRKVLEDLDRERRRSSAYALFLDRLGWDANKIHHGREAFENVRQH